MLLVQRICHLSYRLFGVRFILIAGKCVAEEKTLKTAAVTDFQQLIEIGQSLLIGTEQHWDEIPVERIPTARFGQGLDSLFVAVGHLMLGDALQSRSWFRICAEFFMEADRSPGTVTAEKRALECALFCGDRDFQVEVAGKILPREERIKPMEYPYMMILKYTILDQPAEAALFADNEAWLSRATMKKRGGYGTLQDACKALVHRQPDELTAALDALLSEHKMKASHGRTKMPDGIICFPGAALLKLAHQQNLSLDLRSPFIPNALLD
jgi:hypothetical protein